MTNSKTSTTKKSTTSSTKKATVKTAAKKTTTKKVATKPATKKTTAKKVTAKPAVKTSTKKVEVKPVVEKSTKKVETPVVKKEAKKESKMINWCKENYTIIGLVLLAILLIVNIAIVSIGHKAKLENGKEVIASIDGKKFTADDLFNKLKESYGTDNLLNMIDEYIVNKEVTDKEKVEAKKTAQDQIDKIKAQYTSAGYEWENVLAQYGYANEDALVNEMLLSIEKETIAKNFLKSELKDDDIKAYYEANVFGKYTAKHILVTPKTTDDMTDEQKAQAEETAKATAQDIINRYNNGEDWNTLVTTYSEDTGSKDNEGTVENFTKGDVVDEFWNAVEKLKDGEITSEPVKSTYGYHVIIRVSYTDKKALKDIKDELVEKMISAKLSEDSSLYTKTWVKIRNKYNLELNDTTIKAKYEQTTNKSE